MHLFLVLIPQKVFSSIILFILNLQFFSAIKEPKIKLIFLSAGWRRRTTWCQLGMRRVISAIIRYMAALLLVLKYVICAEI